MWQILKWLWSSPPATALKIEGDGQFGFQVVGESHYQQELERLAGGKSEESCERYCDAWLVPEPDNPHDPSAVCVQIQGVKVGYLASQLAGKYRDHLAPGKGNGRAKCAAVIVCGWCREGGDEGSFGVKLDMTWPPRVKRH